MDSITEPSVTNLINIVTVLSTKSIFWIYGLNSASGETLRLHRKAAFWPVASNNVGALYHKL